MRERRFPLHGYVGLFVLLLGGVLLYLRVRPVTWFFTPLAWTGYILFVDGVVWTRRGRSLLISRTGEFLLVIPLSIVCWLVFEAYNLHIRNWHYEGLPERLWVRWLGYGWSFATIFPGVFETAELIESLGVDRRFRVQGGAVRRGVLILLVVLGVFCLTLPLFLPWSTARYLAVLVWLGFVFLLDPVNYWLGTRSLLRDWEEGRLARLVSLMLAGLVCGVLWEFWNYWAEARWVYDVPIAQNLKIFEMVLPGYLGFLPFALECYLMYHFCLRVLLDVRSE